MGRRVDRVGDGLQAVEKGELVRNATVRRRLVLEYGTQGDNPAPSPSPTAPAPVKDPAFQIVYPHARRSKGSFQHAPVSTTCVEFAGAAGGLPPGFGATKHVRLRVPGPAGARTNMSETPPYHPRRRTVAQAPVWQTSRHASTHRANANNLRSTMQQCARFRACATGVSKRGVRRLMRAPVPAVGRHGWYGRMAVVGDRVRAAPGTRRPTRVAAPKREASGALRARARSDVARASRHRSEWQAAHSAQRYERGDEKKPGNSPGLLRRCESSYSVVGAAAVSAFSGRSTSSTSAIGALSPTRKPNLRMRR